MEIKAKSFIIYDLNSSLRIINIATGECLLYSYYFRQFLRVDLLPPTLLKCSLTNTT